MTVSERFHSDVIRFAIDGIEMIGNNRTGSLIGLDNNGVAFVSEILADKSPEITEGLEPLYQALKTGRFFRNPVKYMSLSVTKVSMGFIPGI